jgi:hypothetical protein
MDERYLYNKIIKKLLKGRGVKLNKKKILCVRKNLR